MIIKNPNKEKYDEVTKAVEKNDGYCPCLIAKNEDTKCICKDFRISVENGYIGRCRCGRYVSVKEEK